MLLLVHSSLPRVLMAACAAGFEFKERRLRAPTSDARIAGCACRGGGQIVL